MKNLNYPMTVLTLVLATVFVASGKSGVSSNQQSGAERWEYCFVYFGHDYHEGNICTLNGVGFDIKCKTVEELAVKLGLGAGPLNRISILNHLGGKGWELMSTDLGVIPEGVAGDRMWFKRRL